MDAEIWAWIGTTVATLLLVVAPGVLYAWYALEHIAEDRPAHTKGH
jgi:hypothetical protein